MPSWYPGVFSPSTKTGRLGTVADQTNTGPEIDGAADAVAALGDKNDAFALAGLELVDRCLDRCAVVFLAVTVDVEFLGGEVDRSWIVEARGIGRSGKADGSHQKRGKQDEKRSHKPNNSLISAVWQCRQLDTALWYVAFPLTTMHSALYKVKANHADMPEETGPSSLAMRYSSHCCRRRNE